MRLGCNLFILTGEKKYAITTFVYAPVRIIDFLFVPLSNFRTAVVSAGIYAFVLSKNSIDAKRVENLKIRQRIRDSNKGDYEVKKYKDSNQ